MGREGGKGGGEDGSVNVLCFMRLYEMKWNGMQI